MILRRRRSRKFIKICSPISSNPSLAMSLLTKIKRWKINTGSLMRLAKRYRSLNSSFSKNSITSTKLSLGRQNLTTSWRCICLETKKSISTWFHLEWLWWWNQKNNCDSSFILYLISIIKYKQWERHRESNIILKMPVLESWTALHLSKGFLWIKT